MFFIKLLLLTGGEEKFALTFSYLNKKILAYYSNSTVQAANLKTCQPKT
jgi:hypothetical protein